MNDEEKAARLAEMKNRRRNMLYQEKQREIISRLLETPEGFDVELYNQALSAEWVEPELDGTMLTKCQAAVDHCREQVQTWEAISNQDLPTLKANKLQALADVAKADVAPVRAKIQAELESAIYALTEAQEMLAYVQAGGA